MKYKRVLTLTAALFTALATMTAQDNGTTHKQNHKVDKSRSEEILQRQIDSLRKENDSLRSITRKQNDNTKPHKTKSRKDNLNYNENDIDSLLKVYYMEQSLNINDFDLRVVDRDSLTSEIPDSVYIERLSQLNSFIPIQFNKSVKNCIIRYTDKMPGATRKIVSLAQCYLPQIEEIFVDEYGLPQELKAMAVIESAFNPRALSRAGAKGMWQFMYVTARQYGLTINSYVDERMDPVKSCRAAAQYLTDSYKVFGDWSLAIASYNCGPGNVLKAIKRSGGKTDFWEIYNYLPSETRGYLPAFIAALYVLKYYPEHGIKPIPVSLPSAVDTFHIHQNIHFNQIAEHTDIPVDVLRDLNPQYFKDMIPGTEKDYILRIPASFGAIYASKEKDIYHSADSIRSNVKIPGDNAKSDSESNITHTVTEGETLAAIAMKYHTTVVEIKKWNNLGENPIQTGQTLTIHKPANTSDNFDQNSPAQKKPTSKGHVMYTVRKGDSLSKIASRHGISLSKLCKLNGMSTKSKIIPGQKIRVR